ncbi:hypothetical protein Nepgr_010818 [Nepenthes gracilis]|uniref:RING-type E3 ubiquitin transferase n=1 Tax=Nepenthes gracilis TaxID=150966 RepID=A0AAD3SD46_NEPGR|nr:hypothetical protein Nepgr_010818 [Nepenthes gracilis]
MMGSERKRLNDVENTVFVAVGKHVKESESTLLWAARSFPGKKICLLHVHQPTQLLTFLDGKFLFNKVKQQALKAFRELEVQKIHKLLTQYVLILNQGGVWADKVWIEMDNIEEGIVKIISQHGIRWLVMGAAADQHYTMEMVEPKSKKAIFVCQQAPLYCQIWFACMGRLIYKREGRKDDLVADVWLERLPFNSYKVNEQSEHGKLHHATQEVGSFPMIAFREHSTILQATSVDFGSHLENNTALSSSKSLQKLCSCMDAEEDGHDLESITPMLTSHCSLNSRLSASKMAGEAQLRTEEICDRLERAMSDAENLKQASFEEAVKRWKSDENAMDAKCMAEAAETSCTIEVNWRKKSEEDLTRQKQALERIKLERGEYIKEIQGIHEKNSSLKSQITESDHKVKELNEKIISAVELLVSFRNQRDQLKIGYENSIEELKRLRRLKEERASSLNGPQFSVFSFMEISLATCCFDPSKRLGEGRYGSVYRGILRHTKVAIKMLPNDGSQGQLDFQHEVEVLSRVRHPNLVTLIGICLESRSLIYEYMERGSLEDHLAGRDNKLPLRWQTRVHIATELCSVLIFLQSNNPSFVHGRLKPDKILLDPNFISKIGDLGIFHLVPQAEAPANASSSSVYIDPEFLENGEPTPLSDVYSFGVILLRLLTGRLAVGIVKDVKYALEKDKFDAMLDLSAGEWPVFQARKLAHIALRCCERKMSLRPDLASEVWSELVDMRNSSDAFGSSSVSEGKLRTPSHFLCPIYQEVMKDPYTAADGFTYEGEAIRGWFSSGHKTSPMTNLKLAHCDLVPNHTLYYAIQDWLKGS